MYTFITKNIHDKRKSFIGVITCWCIKVIGIQPFILFNSKNLIQNVFRLWRAELYIIIMIADNTQWHVL